jgi:uncharacterized protein (TIGR02594 family)
MLEKGSKSEEVVRLQRALNVALARRPPLRPDGAFGSLTEAAVSEFQNLYRLVPDGRVSDELLALIASVAAARGWLERPAKDGPAPWLDIAAAEEGVKETPGIKATPQILEYIGTMPYLGQVLHDTQLVPMSTTDETAWCACFVNWCLIRAGQRHHASAMAREWLDYGIPLDARRPGAICVIFNKDLPATTSARGWHVGFWVADGSTGPVLLGGNQSNRVMQKEMPGEIKGLRWPG